MNISKTCIYCNAPLYLLNDGRVKCSACAARYSPKHINAIRHLIRCFCNDLTAHEAARELKNTYVTVSKYYKQFRSLAALACERDYEAQRQNVGEYEEYLYLEHSKRQRKEAIFDAHNFITFDYGDKVYNVLMPSLAKYKEQFLDDGLESVYHRELSRFMRQSKIIKIKARYNTITAFWEFFENFILRYKGISTTYFAYYLKEAEFKFNYDIASRHSVLESLYFSNSKRDKPVVL